MTLKPIPTEPAKRFKYFQAQVALLKAKRAPEPLIAACRAKMREAKAALSQPKVGR